jgi:hypothetical protein
MIYITNKVRDEFERDNKIIEFKSFIGYEIQATARLYEGKPNTYQVRWMSIDGETETEYMTTTAVIRNINKGKWKVKPLAKDNPTKLNQRELKIEFEKNFPEFKYRTDDGIIRSAKLQHRDNDTSLYRIEWINEKGNASHTLMSTNSVMDNINGNGWTVIDNVANVTYGKLRTVNLPDEFKYHTHSSHDGSLIFTVKLYDASKETYRIEWYNIHGQPDYMMTTATNIIENINNGIWIVESKPSTEDLPVECLMDKFDFKHAYDNITIRHAVKSNTKIDGAEVYNITWTKHGEDKLQLIPYDKIKGFVDKGLWRIVPMDSAKDKPKLILFDSKFMNQYNHFTFGAKGDSNSNVHSAKLVDTPDDLKSKTEHPLVY